MSLVKRYGKVVATALPLIAGAEGLRTVAYMDPVGIPTICFGETAGVQMGDQKTVAKCRAMLSDRTEEFAIAVDSAVTPHYPAEAMAAFTSFTYNVGVGAFQRSTLLKKANRGDLAGACAELSRWVYAKGIKLPGLVTRRAEERALCESALK